MKRSLIMPLMALAGAACVTTLAFGASGRFAAPRVAAADPITNITSITVFYMC